MTHTHTHTQTSRDKPLTGLRCGVCYGDDGYWVDSSIADERTICPDCFNMNRLVKSNILKFEHCRVEAYERGIKLVDNHVRVANVMKYGPMEVVNQNPGF